MSGVELRVGLLRPKLFAVLHHLVEHAGRLGAVCGGLAVDRDQRPRFQIL